ncbi:MAG: hypothetical protein U0103_29700 [Candidatus Obscuribacterales bacterium]
MTIALQFLATLVSLLLASQVFAEEGVSLPRQVAKSPGQILAARKVEYINKMQSEYYNSLFNQHLLALLFQKIDTQNHLFIECHQS